MPLAFLDTSFLDQNNDKVKGAKVDGVDPTFENIAEGMYPISRPLYFYVKKAHVGVIPGLRDSSGNSLVNRHGVKKGYLSDRGLIPMPDEERAQIGNAVNSLTPM